VSAGRRLLAVADALPVTVLAVIAGAGSFTHIRDTAAEHGQGGPMSWAVAVCVDLTCVMAARERQRDKQQGVVTRRLSWPAVVLAGGVLLSLAANLAQAQPTAWGRIVAAVPPAAFLVAVSMIERRAARRPRPIADEDGSVGEPSAPGRPSPLSAAGDEAVGAVSSWRMFSLLATLPVVGLRGPLSPLTMVGTCSRWFGATIMSWAWLRSAQLPWRPAQSSRALHALVAADDVLAGLVPGGPELGAARGLVIPPGQRFRERPAEDLAEVPGLRDRAVLDQSEEVGPGGVSGRRMSYSRSPSSFQGRSPGKLR
jgi:hypothetical protein